MLLTCEILKECYGIFLPNNIYYCPTYISWIRFSDSKGHGANMGHNWDLSAPDGPHVGPHESCYQGFVITIHGSQAIGSFSDMHQFITDWITVLYGLRFCKKFSLVMYKCPTIFDDEYRKPSSICCVAWWQNISACNSANSFMNEPVRSCYQWYLYPSQT